jgi:hypothetical protein
MKQMCVSQLSALLCSRATTSVHPALDLVGYRIENTLISGEAYNLTYFIVFSDVSSFIP